MRRRFHLSPAVFVLAGLLLAVILALSVLFTLQANRAQRTAERTAAAIASTSTETTLRAFIEVTASLSSSAVSTTAQPLPSDVTATPRPQVTIEVSAPIGVVYAAGSLLPLPVTRRMPIQTVSDTLIRLENPAALAGDLAQALSDPPGAAAAAGMDVRILDADFDTATFTLAIIEPGSSEAGLLIIPNAFTAVVLLPDLAVIESSASCLTVDALESQVLRIGCYGTSTCRIADQVIPAGKQVTWHHAPLPNGAQLRATPLDLVALAAHHQRFAVFAGEDAAPLACLQPLLDADQDTVLLPDDTCPDAAGEREFDGCTPPTLTMVALTRTSTRTPTRAATRTVTPSRTTVTTTQSGVTITPIPPMSRPDNPASTSAPMFAPTAVPLPQNTADPRTQSSFTLATQQEQDRQTQAAIDLATQQERDRQTQAANQAATAAANQAATNAAIQAATAAAEAQQTQAASDDDGDGVPNGSDACPNEAGDPGNGGCPAPAGG
ncbi:MAG: hypothetical protein SF162_06445 [bacterium]|nr:hypothetical protein [bacterium]